MRRSCALYPSQYLSIFNGIVLVSVRAQRILQCRGDLVSSSAENEPIVPIRLQFQPKTDHTACRIISQTSLLQMSTGNSASGYTRHLRASISQTFFRSSCPQLSSAAGACGTIFYGRGGILMGLPQ